MFFFLFYIFNTISSNSFFFFPFTILKAEIILKHLLEFV